jgi:hypothetical protein
VTSTFCAGRAEGCGAGATGGVTLITEGVNAEVSWTGTGKPQVHAETTSSFVYHHDETFKNDIEQRG